MLKDQVVDIAQKLIQCKSITPSDGDSIEFITGLLNCYGFKTYVKEFGPNDYKVKNLYAIHGNLRPNFCFAGHVDVVPPGTLNLWSHDPFSGTIENGKMYGRGATDMKGAVSAMLCAAIDFITGNNLNNGSISFLITSDEEGIAQYGTKKMLQWLEEKNQKLDFCLIGEPTCKNTFGDVLQIGRRGSINFILKIFGKQGHVAYVETFDNPHVILIKVLNDLTNYKFDDGNENFCPSKLEITSIDTGNVHVSNVVPSETQARFNIRFNNLHSAEKIISTCNNIIKKYTDDFELTTLVDYSEPFVISNNKFIDKIIDVVKDETGVIPELSTYGGTSDARFIKKYCDVVEFGLLTNSAHQINEYLNIEDLKKLYNIYYNMLRVFY